MPMTGDVQRCPAVFPSSGDYILLQQVQRASHLARWNFLRLCAFAASIHILLRFGVLLPSALILSALAAAIRIPRSLERAVSSTGARADL